MSEELTYKDRLRRTELVQLHTEFLARMDDWRSFVGIPDGGFFCYMRAQNWDRCQKTEPAPEEGGRAEGICVAETAHPQLEDNDCYDNTSRDIRDERR